MSDPYRRAADTIRAAGSVVAVTGAGISVESGVPDFRSPGGIWERYPPEEYASIQGYLANPNKVWQFWRELGQMVKDCEPNPAHHALARLERAGHLHAVVTQNVDSLHHAAGSMNVVEYHGNARELACLDCGATRSHDRDNMGDTAPRCTCGGLMKPALVMFGELIPPAALAEAERMVRACDVVLVVGTSAQVYPAAGLPPTAKSSGAFVIEANISETGFTNSITDAFLKGPAGETLPRLVEYVEKAD